MMDSSEIFRCNKCPKLFSILGRYNQHLETHSRPFQCDQCEKGFALRSDLTRHTQARHRLGKARHACIVEHCTFKATRKDNISQHLRKSHPDSHLAYKPSIKLRRQENDPLTLPVISISGHPGSDTQQPLARLPTLMQAATSGNVGLVEAILALGVEVSAAADDGSTALHCAARANETEVARYLLQAGAQVDVLNIKKRTPLHEAVMGKSMETFTLLTQHGARVTEDVLGSVIKTGQVEILQYTLNYPGNRLVETLSLGIFGMAARAEQTAIMAMLLAMPEITREWITEKGHLVIYRIVWSGQTTMLKLMLMSNKLDPTMRIGWRRRYGLLQLAAIKGHGDIVRLLVRDNSVNINKTSGSSAWTPLQIAAARGHASVIEILLQRPGLIIVPEKRQTVTKSNALHLACRGGHLLAVKSLLRVFDERGLSVDGTDCTSRLRTPLANAVECGHTNVVKLLLLRKDIRFNTRVKSGRTLLQLAALGEHCETLSLLMCHDGIDFTIEANRRHSLLFDAAYNSHWPTVGFLLDYDEKSVHFDNSSPLINQKEEDELNIMRRLVFDKDFSLNLTGLDGGNLWHLSAKTGNLSLAMLLFEQYDCQRRHMPPVDINLRNNRGETPLHVAIGRCDHNVLKLLLLHKDVDVNARTGVLPYAKALDEALRRFGMYWYKREEYAYIVDVLLVHGARCSLGKAEDLRMFLQSQQRSNDHSPAATLATTVGLEGPNVASPEGRSGDHRTSPELSWATIASVEGADMTVENVEVSSENQAEDNELEEYDEWMEGMTADFINDHDLEMDDMTGHEDNMY